MVPIIMTPLRRKLVIAIVVFFFVLLMLFATPAIAIDGASNDTALGTTNAKTQTAAGLVQGGTCTQHPPEPANANA